MVNSKTIRPETDGIDANTPINSIRISRSVSKSSYTSVSTTGSYYLSFSDKGNSFLHKIRPYLLGTVPDNSIGKNRKHNNQKEYLENMSDNPDEFVDKTNDDDNSTNVSAFNIQFIENNEK